MELFSLNNQMGYVDYVYFLLPLSFINQRYFFFHSFTRSFVFFLEGSVSHVCWLRVKREEKKGRFSCRRGFDRCNYKSIRLAVVKGGAAHPHLEPFALSLSLSLLIEQEIRNYLNLIKHAYVEL